MTDGRKGLSDKVLSLIRPHLDKWVSSDADFSRYLNDEYSVLLIFY